MEPWERHGAQGGRSGARKPPAPIDTQERIEGQEASASNRNSRERAFSVPAGIHDLRQAGAGGKGQAEREADAPGIRWGQDEVKKFKRRR